MDTYSVEPIERPYDVEIRLPGSKSIALRQLLMSALANRPTDLVGIPQCDDVDTMLAALRRLGVKCSQVTDQVRRIEPKGLDLSSNITLDVQMSGVSLRFLCALAMLRSGTTRFTGAASLRARPNGPLLDALAQLGCRVDSKEGKLPIAITGRPKPKSHVTIDASVSSQYISALLLVAPRLCSGLTLHLTRKRASGSYVDLTIDEMSKRGIDCSEIDNGFRIDPGEYSRSRIDIEGDASALSYHAALATLHKSELAIPNISASTHQGDYQFLTICEKIGADVERKPSGTIVRGRKAIEAVNEVDMSEMPDTAPTLMALAPYLPKSTHITGLSTLPLKECNRIECPATELRRAGIEVETTREEMTIHPRTPKSATFRTYDDHRMAMSMTILASRIQGCQIVDPGCVNKTYPDFWCDYEKLHLEQTAR